MSRLSINSMFKGKTVAGINTNAWNMWVFRFTDGTRIAVETEHKGMGVYGFSIVPERDLAVPARLSRFRKVARK